MAKIISFDIWDTIIKRKCHPEEIKLATARYIVLKYENESDSFLIDINKKRFSKENLESILEITESNSFITLKEIDKTFEIDLKKCNFLKVKDKIVIEYLLESQEKPIKIEIEMSDSNA